MSTVLEWIFCIALSTGAVIAAVFVFFWLTDLLRRFRSGRNAKEPNPLEHQDLDRRAFEHRVRVKLILNSARHDIERTLRDHRESK